MPNLHTATGRTARTLALGGVAALLLSACGATDYAGGAADVIEGEIADQLGLGTLSAECTVAEGEVEVGTTFPCTATTEDGQTIELTATVSAEDYVDVATDNVVLASDLAFVESIAADSLAESVGIALPAENVDCGELAVIVSDGSTIECALTDPGNGDVYDMTLSEIDLTEDGGIFFDIAVAEEPRS